WIAANELPLVDELIPFLLARSGQALDEFCRWVAPRRPLHWVLTMLNYLPMSLPTREELVRMFSLGMDDPEVMARRRQNLRMMLDLTPQLRHELLEDDAQKLRLEGRLTEARAALRRILARRQLTPSNDDNARIEACGDLATLERWHDCAVTAA